MPRRTVRLQQWQVCRRSINSKISLFLTQGVSPLPRLERLAIVHSRLRLHFQDDYIQPATYLQVPHVHSSQPSCEATSSPSPSFSALRRPASSPAFPGPDSVDGFQRELRGYMPHSDRLSVQRADRTHFRIASCWVVRGCDNMSLVLHCGTSSFV